MKPRQSPRKNSVTDKIRSFFGSTTAIALSIPFWISTNKTKEEAAHAAAMAKADETIARIDATRAESKKSMEESDKVLAEVESNKNRFGCNN